MNNHYKTETAAELIDILNYWIPLFLSRQTIQPPNLTTDLREDTLDY